MSTSWTPTPTGVRRGTTGPSRAASFGAGLLTIVGTTLALLIAAAILFPGTFGGDGAGIAAASPTPPSAVTPIASAPPSGSIAPQATPAAATTPAAPTPTATPTRAPSATAPTLVEIRETAPLTVAGREIGSVTVQAVRQVRTTTTEVPAGRRLMVATIRINSGASRLPYDEVRWRIEDENGDRWEPIAAAVPKPLGSGTLAPEAGRTGGVAFVIPTGVRVRSVVLTDDDGADLLVFGRPTVTS